MSDDVYNSYTKLLDGRSQRHVTSALSLLKCYSHAHVLLGLSVHNVDFVYQLLKLDSRHGSIYHNMPLSVPLD